MSSRPLHFAIATLALAALSPQAFACDPVAGALVGGGIGAAIGNAPGAAVGAVIGFTSIFTATLIEQHHVAPGWAWLAAQRGVRVGWYRALPGWRSAPLRSDPGISAGYSPFRSSPRHYAGLSRPEPSSCAGRSTSAGTFAAAATIMLYIAGRPSYRLGIAKETAMVRTFSSSLTSY